jgi:replication-associated recombination protein RarA
MQKCVRRGDEDEALYWATELDRSGYGEYVWRRLRIMCSEDVGVAEPNLPANIRALYDNWSDARKKKDDRQESWRLFLVHAVILLTRASKSRIVDHALLAYYSENDVREIPDVALDKHTLAGKRKRRGWDHFFGDGSLLVNHDTGELQSEPVLDDPYRERAIAAMTPVTRVVKR